MDRATRWMTIATAMNGVAVGATLDQAVKQLPARHRIGPSAYLDYARAADLRNGLLWYPVLGIGTAAVSLTAAAMGMRGSADRARILPLVAVAAATVIHAAATSRAAPIMIGLRRGSPDPSDIAAALDRFARINAVRAAAMITALAAAGWAAARPQPTVLTSATR
jgi:hypothetical protein